MSLSYTAQNSGAWQTYLTQIDRVTPYLDADLGNFINTLKRPKRTLIVDVPIVMDDGTIRHLKATVYNTTYHVVQVKVVFVITTMLN